MATEKGALLSQISLKWDHRNIQSPAGKKKIPTSDLVSIYIVMIILVIVMSYGHQSLFQILCTMHKTDGYIFVIAQSIQCSKYSVVHHK